LLNRAALRLYPASHRERFGDEAEATFVKAHEVARRGGVGRELRFWMAWLPDVAASAAGVWRREFRRKRKPVDRVGRRSSRIGTDVKFAVRSIRRQPATTLAIALTLALGIGAVTTVFSLAEWLLLRPVPGVAGERSAP
jgi:hypothetical protein